MLFKDTKCRTNPMVPAMASHMSMTLPSYDGRHCGETGSIVETGVNTYTSDCMWTADLVRTKCWDCCAATCRLCKCMRPPRRKPVPRAQPWYYMPSGIAKSLNPAQFLSTSLYSVGNLGKILICVILSIGYQPMYCYGHLVRKQPSR